MKIKVTPMRAADLKPGDLFSTAGPEFWDAIWEEPLGSVGQRVYIRTTTPTPADQADEKVFRIEIMPDTSQGVPADRFEWDHEGGWALSHDSDHCWRIQVRRDGKFYAAFDFGVETAFDTFAEASAHVVKS